MLLHKLYTVLYSLPISDQHLGNILDRGIEAVEVWRHPYRVDIASDLLTDLKRKGRISRQGRDLLMLSAYLELAKLENIASNQEQQCQGIQPSQDHRMRGSGVLRRDWRLEFAQRPPSARASWNRSLSS